MSILILHSQSFRLKEEWDRRKEVSTSLLSFGVSKLSSQQHRWRKSPSKLSCNVMGIFSLRCLETIETKKTRKHWWPCPPFKTARSTYIENTPVALWPVTHTWDSRETTKRAVDFAFNRKIQQSLKSTLNPKSSRTAPSTRPLSIPLSRFSFRVLSLNFNFLDRL